MVLNGAAAELVGLDMTVLQSTCWEPGFSGCVQTDGHLQAGEWLGSGSGRGHTEGLGGEHLRDSG